jgi:DNA-binding beta-propeller fold protein YncE
MKRSGPVLLALLCLCAPAGASEGNLSQIAGLGDPLLAGASEVVVSPDGEHVYATAYDADALLVLDRNPATGALTKLGCLSESGSGGACQDVLGIDFPDGLAISPDGNTVYVAGQTSDSVAIFDRDPATGALTQLPGDAGCVAEVGTATCVGGKALDGAVGVTVSADGDNVYVVSHGSDAIAIFDRNETTGAITMQSGPAGCVSETGSGGACQNGRGLDGPYPGVVATADGKSVYVPSHDDDAVSVLDRDPATGALTPRTDTTGCVSEDGNGGECTDGATLGDANFIVEDPGSDHIYVASSISGAINVYDRAANGTLTFDSCVSDDGSGGACTDVRGLAGALGLGISPNGESVYAVAGTADALTVFDRGADGELLQKPGTAGCIAESGDGVACGDGTQLDGPRGLVAVSPDGKNVYVAGSLSSAVAAFSRQPNGRPVCAPLNAGSIKHDSAVTFTLGCTDPDGDPLTMAVVSAPAHGTLGAIDQATGKVTYTPAEGYVGSDSFTYRASDAAGAGDAATVSVTFTNQAPVCTDSSVRVQSGASRTLTVSCTDGDGDALELTVVKAPTLGTLATPNNVTRSVQYTAGRSGGNDSFAIRATDRTGASGTHTVSVFVEIPACCAPPPPPKPTPTPQPTVTVPITQVATLPSPRRCVSRRRFRIRLRGVKGNRIVRAEIKLDGKVVRRVRGRALSLPIDLRGLPRGRWRVEIATTDSTGRRVVGRRTYRSCAPRRAG